MRGDAWLESFVPYLLYRVTNALNGRLKARLRASGINLARWRVLAVLKAYGSMNMGGIVAATAMEQPTLSRVVDQLESEGLVERHASTGDSRFVYVDLTRAGRAAFAAIAPLAARHQALALRGFTKAEIATLRRLLGRIQKNVGSAD
jgi:DNA-binding MarR family transcriptional regulator